MLLLRLDCLCWCIWFDFGCFCVNNVVVFCCLDGGLHLVWVIFVDRCRCWVLCQRLSGCSICICRLVGFGCMYCDCCWCCLLVVVGCGYCLAGWLGWSLVVCLGLVGGFLCLLAGLFCLEVVCGV